MQVKDKQEREEREWAEKLEQERARTLNKVSNAWIFTTGMSDIYIIEPGMIHRRDILVLASVMHIQWILSMRCVLFGVKVISLGLVVNGATQLPSVHAMIVMTVTKPTTSGRTKDELQGEVRALDRQGGSAGRGPFPQDRG